jgi:hypothetical protein
MDSTSFRMSFLNLRFQERWLQHFLLYFIFVPLLYARDTVNRTANKGPVRIQYKSLIWNVIHSQTNKKLTARIT